MRVFYRATPTVYNGHFRGLVTLTPIAERLAMELSLPVLNGRFKSVAAGTFRGERSDELRPPPRFYVS